MFGTFGGVTAVQNQKVAGHANLRMSERYTEDAENLLELYKLQRDKTGHHGVSKYRPIECKGPHNAGLVNERCKKFQKPLNELARMYVEDQLG